MSRWITIFFVLAAGSLVSACSPTAEAPATELATQTAALPTFTQAAPVLTSTPTNIPIPPTSTPQPTQTETALLTATPSATLSPTATSSPTATPGKTSGNSLGIINAADPLRIYLIELKPGKGCEYGVVPVKINAARTKDLEKDIETALKTLLGNKSEYWGSLYNPVFRSTLNVNNVEVDGETAYIWLTGRYVPSKDKCDNARVKAQIWSTIRQFRDVTRPIIYLNAALLGDVLSNDN